VKKFITVIAVVCMVALAAGQAFAGKTFKPEEINTTAGDGFLYFYPQGETASETITVYDTVSAIDFQLTLVESTPISPNPVKGSADGSDQFSGTIALPVGAVSTTPALVTFNISAIRDATDLHWSYKGTDSTGAILVSGEITFWNETKDETGPKPSLKKTYEISGFVTGNGTNFNGCFHGKMYAPK
jgi:hypothetical protein